MKKPASRENIQKIIDKQMKRILEEAYQESCTEFGNMSHEDFRSFIQPYTKTLIWTKKKPTEEGYYLFKKYSEWVKKPKEVHKGDWKQRQNPDELYAFDIILSSSELEGWWYGPIPEIPEKV